MSACIRCLTGPSKRLCHPRMRWCWLAVVVLTLWAVQEVSSQSYCLATDNNPYLFFATRTAYEFVYEKKINHRSIPGCRAVQMWMLARHGTSYPNRQKFLSISQLDNLRDRIIHNHRTRKNGELCHEDLEALSTWRFSAQEDRADTLAEQGRQDMIYLAKRLKSNFRSILDTAYTPDRFTFKFSGEEVARGSAQAFAEELLGHSSPVYLTDANTDYRLSADNCTTLREPETSSKLEFEIEKFRQSPLAAGLLQSVSSRLGFLYNLTLETIQDIYDVCGYEKAWNYSKTSPWCAAFTKRDLKVLEYLEDLKQFYKNGYGNQLALRFGCPLVKDLMQNFKRAADGDDEVPSGVFYWGDEALLEAVMTRLGIANDKRQLPASLSSLTSQEKRQWRTAFISPYAGNIAAVFYKCSSGEANQVMFYINEHIVEYEGCQVGLCSWEYLSTRFAPVISGPCDYEFCETLTDSAVHVTTSACLLLAVLVQLHFLL